MGRRFGRNKKRAMRAELELVDQQRRAAERRAVELGADCRRLAETVQSVRDAFGASGLLPADERFDRARTDEVRFRWREPVGPFVPRAPFEAVRSVDYSLRILDVEVRRDPAKHPGGHHVVVRHSGLGWSYYLDERALRDLPPPVFEQAVRRVAEEIMLKLSESGIRAATGHPRR